MRKAVSIALFGDATRKDGSGQNYHRYLPTFVLAHANLFPRVEGWELHVHVDNTTLNGPYGRMLLRMAEADLLNVRSHGSAILTRAMLWRMTPVFAVVDAPYYVFPRDIDALPMPRDREVCDVFIASNCMVHTVHDSLSHAGIMGGLCGFQSAAFKQSTGLGTLNDLYDFAKKTEDEWALHGTDQLVLNRLVDHANGPTLLEHRYNGWHSGPKTKAVHKAGEYRCKSWSTPIPDIGKSKLGNELQFEADLLANHMGAAGYEVGRARFWWERHGDQKLSQLVRACE